MAAEFEEYLLPMGGPPEERRAMFWFNHIGWIGYYFAQLEWASYWLAAEVGTAQQKDAIGGKGFVSRNQYCKKHIVANISQPQVRHQWMTFFDEINDCAEMRNDILHNPLESNLNKTKSLEVKFEQGIRLMRDGGGKVIELGDVQQFNRRLVELNDKMIELMRQTVGLQ